MQHYPNHSGTGPFGYNPNQLGNEIKKYLEP